MYIYLCLLWSASASYFADDAGCYRIARCAGVLSLSEPDADTINTRTLHPQSSLHQPLVCWIMFIVPPAFLDSILYFMQKIYNSKIKVSFYFLCFVILFIIFYLNERSG